MRCVRYYIFFFFRRSRRRRRRRRRRWFLRRYYMHVLFGWLVGRLVGCLVIIIYLLWSIRTGLKNYFVCESENKLRVWLHWIYKGSAYLSHSLYVFFFQKYSFPFACSFTFDSFIFNINACFIHALFPFRLFTVQCTKGRLHCTHKKRRMREITSNMQLLLNIDIDCPP